jgi:centrosomal CEP192-like protein
MVVRVIACLLIVLALPTFPGAFRGAGATPAAQPPQFSATAISFPSQSLGTSSEAKSIVITNRATAALFIFKVSASPDFAVRNHCTRPLRRGESCEIQVIFSPTFAGETEGAVTIVDSSEGSPHAITVSGAGRVPSNKERASQ